MELILTSLCSITFQNTLDGFPVVLILDPLKNAPDIFPYSKVNDRRQLDSGWTGVEYQYYNYRSTSSFLLLLLPLHNVFLEGD